MSQHNSGYERVPFDLYETPEWVTAALIPHLRQISSVLEPACGSGKMVRALNAGGYKVTASDISKGEDFLHTWHCEEDAIITNPPYSFATEFIENALKLTVRNSGLVAMLLRTDFDHAKGRANLFANCPQFSKKVVLTKRIVWFENKGAAPSFNHAWFIWDWKHTGSPQLAYDIQA